MEEGVKADMTDKMTNSKRRDSQGVMRSKVWHHFYSKRKVAHSSFHIYKKKWAGEYMGIGMKQKELNNILNVRVCNFILG